MKKIKKITVGIPTYFGGKSLVRTVRSILASRAAPLVRLIVTVDGNPLEAEIRRNLNSLGVEVLENKERLGQVGRIKQLIALARTELLILTQDDVLYEPLTIKKIVEEFEKEPKVTMASVTVLPTAAKTPFESVLEVGVRLNYRVGLAKNHGDNYLLASGRCLVFRTAFVKEFNIPDKVINSDAYLYFENKRNKGKFKFISDARVYIKSPQNLGEHIKQSRKFLFSKEELSQFSLTGINLEEEFSVGYWTKAKAFLQEFLSHPMYSILYFIDFVYTRTQKKNMYQKKTRFWDTDKSTKQI